MISWILTLQKIYDNDLLNLVHQDIKTKLIFILYTVY